MKKYFFNSHIKIGYFDKNDADLKFQDDEGVMVLYEACKQYIKMSYRY